MNLFLFFKFANYINVTGSILYSGIPYLCTTYLCRI